MGDSEPPSDVVRRRLAVILASDVAGYSRLVSVSEEDTVARFRRSAEVFGELVRRYHGRVFNTAGDAILAEFDSAVNAMRCAIDIQEATAGQNVGLAPDRHILFRIGIAIGDVIVADSGDLFGDGVNIAARLQTLAATGGICISQEVRTLVANKIALRFVDIGEQKLKNMAHPVRAFQIAAGGLDDLPGGAAWWRARAMAAVSPRRWTVASLGLVAIAALAAGLIQWQHRLAGIVTAETVGQFDAMLVPLVDDETRRLLSGYASKPDYKALAISDRGLTGMSTGAATADEAKQEALMRCRRAANMPCILYAAGPDVVWPNGTIPVPLPADIRAEPIGLPFTVESAAIIAPSVKEQYLKQPLHRALGVSANRWQFWANRSTREEAIRLVVERCSQVGQVPCLVVSVDDDLTVRFPSTRGVLRPFTLAGETQMSAADKTRIAQVYGGPDWRALAVGSRSGWYPVAGAASEQAAVQGALDACRAAETECSIHAIGNFVVGMEIPAAPSDRR